LVILGGGIMMLIVSQICCLVLLKGPGDAATQSTTAAATTQAATAVELSPLQMAVSMSVPPLMTFVFMVLANMTIRRHGLSGLGLTRSHFKRGVATGIVGSVIAVPLAFFAAWGTQKIWELIHYEHAKEHDLLRKIGEEGSSGVSVLLIAAAVVVAPLAEEMLFRGHLQTLLTHGFSRLSQWKKRRPMAHGFDVIVPGGLIGHVELPAARQPFTPPTVAIRWTSVLVTSLLFGLVHPLWMTPPIFVLAVCLGYAYERTGNLWTTITMHALFNGTSTMLYLLGPH
jgi:membrane protease YdiL (CAAX protease family)